MWVPRPYASGLLTLWMGFGRGAGDGSYDRFAIWLQQERYPAPGGHKNPLSPDALVRRAVTGGESSGLTETEDDKAVALLSDLVREYRAL